MNDEPGGMKQEECELLARITLQIDRCSTYQHALSRRGKILRDAATDLRLGRQKSEVLARIHAQIPDAVRVMEAMTE